MAVRLEVLVVYVSVSESVANNAACQSRSNAEEDGVDFPSLHTVFCDCVCVCVSQPSLVPPHARLVYASLAWSGRVWFGLVWVWFGLVWLVGCWCHILGKILVANFGKTWPSIWPQVRQSETDAV